MRHFLPFWVWGGCGLWLGAGSFTDFCLFTCRLWLVLPTAGPLFLLFIAYLVIMDPLSFFVTRLQLLDSLPEDHSCLLSTCLACHWHWDQCNLSLTRLRLLHSLFTNYGGSLSVYMWHTYRLQLFTLLLVAHFFLPVAMQLIIFL